MMNRSKPVQVVIAKATLPLFRIPVWRVTVVVPGKSFGFDWAEYPASENIAMTMEAARQRWKLAA